MLPPLAGRTGRNLRCTFMARRRLSIHVLNWRSLRFFRCDHCSSNETCVRIIDNTNTHVHCVIQDSRVASTSCMYGELNRLTYGTERVVMGIMHWCFTTRPIRASSQTRSQLPHAPGKVFGFVMTINKEYKIALGTVFKWRWILS